MALDDVDSALADYQPTDTEDQVQDESVKMQNLDGPDPQAVDAETPGSNGQVSDGELDRISGTTPPTPTMPAGQLGAPNPMAAATQALDAGNATAAAQKQVGEAIGERDQSLADSARDREVQARLDEQERADQAAAQHAALEKTHAETEAAAKKFDEFKFHDHWKEAPVANKVLAVLFSGIGGAAAARTGGQNEALRAMDDISQREYQKDVQNLNKAETFYKWKKEGETDLQGRFEKEKAGLQMQQSARLKQMADMAESHYLRTHPGATVDEAKSNQITAGLTQKAAETYSSAVQNIYKIEAAKQAATLRDKKAKSGGGAFSGNALTKFTEAANAIKPGEAIPPSVMVLGHQAGLKVNQISAEVDRIRNSGVKAEKGEAGIQKIADANDALAFRDESGNVLGTFPNARAKTKFTEKDADYTRSREQLQALLDDVEKNGERALSPEATKRRATLYHDAVIGVATVSPLGKTNESQKIEAESIGPAGTLKDGLMMGANPTAIRNKIKQLDTQQKRYRVQELAPLKGAAKGSTAESKSEKSSPTVVESRSIKGEIWNKMSDGSFVKSGG